MAITRYAAVVDAVLAALRADAGLLNVEVIDGPPLESQSPPVAIYIGWRGDIEDDSAGSISQRFHDTGPAAKRDEMVDVYGVVQVVAGDDDMAAIRLEGARILGVVETALRASFSLGLADVRAIELTDGAVRQVRNGSGIGIEFDFTISASSII
jgi:hypothetical protein